MKKINAVFTLLFLVNMIANAQSTTLGVGINPPVGTLHVHSSAGFIPPVTPGIEPGTGNRDDYDYHTIFHITNTCTGSMNNDGFEISQYNNDVTLRQWETGKMNFFRSNGQGFTLSSAGYLGIGTTTPTKMLHVVGDGLVEGTMQIDGNETVGDVLTVANRAVLCSNGQPLCIGKAHVYELGFGSTYIGFNAQRMGASGWQRKNNTWLNGGAVIWATMSGDIFFANLPSTGGDDVSGISDEEIMESVNLALTSDGLLKAKEIKVTLVDWPDYVFSKDYRLMSLPETDAYIKENGHLPGVPSAEEVEAEGLSLGEINKALIQKVEELTLHVIELQKQIDELKVSNSTK